MKIPQICFLATCTLAGFALAAITSNLNPYQAKYPGTNTLDAPNGEIPATVQAFLPFKNRVGLSWDHEFLYIEGNCLPDHPMMKGITAWNGKVPFPHDYTGDNCWKLPLTPVWSDEPAETSLVGANAIAVNGIPIFHSLSQSGSDTYLGGELDEWGGHSGRADDYHYHLAPAHLEEVVGKGKPVAFGLDGYPICIADPSKDKPLDECHGYKDEEGNYRYIGDLTPPYMMGAFRGVADLEARPRAGGIRPPERASWTRGATVTGVEGSLKDGFRLGFESGDSKGTIDYKMSPTGGVDFRFTLPDGTSSEQTFLPRGGKGKGKGKAKGKKKGGKGKGK